MNTTEAAATAGVSAATIRHWARLGAIAATKTGGRWAIDPDSLNRRTALGVRRPAPRIPDTLTAEQAIALGGSRWQRSGMDRVYFNDWHAYAGIDVGHYNTGNVSSFSIDGRSVANSRAARILGAVSKVYLDVADGRIYVKHYGAREMEVRFRDGERAELDLVARISRGIREAAAAL